MTTDVDVAVIGGGVVGLCVARALQERGRHVTVIERADLGAECSTGNAGLVVPSHVVPLAAPGVIGQGIRWLLRRDSPFRIKPRLDVGLLSWLWTFYNSCNERHVEESIPVLRDLSLKSRALYEKWAGTNGTATFGFEPSGLLMAHETEKGRSKDLEEAKRARDAGLEVSIFDRDEVKKRVPHLPPSVSGGVYYHQDALLDPTRLIDALEGQLEREDTDLRRGIAVTGFESENGTIQSIHTTEGPVHPEDVVLAAGAWSGSLGKALGLDIPVEPAKGYSVTVDVPEGRPSMPFILTEKKISVTPLGRRVRFAGTLELAGFDASVDSHRLQPILDVAAGYVPTVPDGTHPWVGFRPCTPDGLPVVGPVSKYDNLVLATGHGMLGVSLSPITGQLVAEVIEGEQPAVDLAPLLLARFN